MVTVAGLGFDALGDGGASARCKFGARAVPVLAAGEERRFGMEVRVLRSRREVDTVHAQIEQLRAGRPTTVEGLEELAPVEK